VIQGTNKPCVRGSPPLQQSSIILGDVFFHSYAVEFDMRLSTRTHPGTIGLAAINPHYKIIPESTPIIPITQAGTPLVRMHVHKDVDKLPIDNERGVKYFVQVTIGTPPQVRPPTSRGAPYRTTPILWIPPHDIGPELHARRPWHGARSLVASSMSLVSCARQHVTCLVCTAHAAFYAYARSPKACSLVY
jgi:hypothetical protein